MGNKLMLPLEVIAFSKDAICMLKKNNQEDTGYKESRQACMRNRIQMKRLVNASIQWTERVQRPWYKEGNSGINQK